MRLLTLALTLAVGLVLAPVPAAHAANTYTWTGKESNDWGNRKNWQPEGVPQNGDSVELGPGPRPTITGVKDVTLASLKVTGSDAGLVSMSGDATVTVGNLQWQGGDINVGLTISAPPFDPQPSFIARQEVPMRFGGAPDQTLTVLSSLSLLTGPIGGDDPWLTLTNDADIRVASTGTLLLDPGAEILGSRCCTAGTSTLTVDGTLEVYSITGATGFVADLREVGVDLAGDVKVPAGNTLRITGGPVRVGGDTASGTVGDASIGGGGTVDVAETEGPAYDPADPRRQDGSMKFLDDGEELMLRDDTVLRLGPASEVSGVGRVVGNGSVRLAGTTVEGRLTTADGVPASTEAGTRTTLDPDGTRPNVTGVLVPEGGLRLDPGSTLRVLGGGGRLAVPDDAILEVPAGSVLDSGGCCVDTGRVTLAPDATMEVGEDTGAGDVEPAVLRWVELGGNGTITHTGESTWDVPPTAFTSGARITGDGTITGDLPAGPSEIRPTGVLTVDGDLTTNTAGSYRPELDIRRDVLLAPRRLVVTGTAALSGRLRPIGDTTYPAGRRVVVLEAGAVTGGFRCAVAGGTIMDQRATDVGLVGIRARVSDCLAPAPAVLSTEKIRGGVRADLQAPAGVTGVLVEVALSRVRRATTMRVDAGRGTVRVQVPRGSSTRLLEVPVAAGEDLTVRLGSSGRIRLEQVGWVSP